MLRLAREVEALETVAEQGSMVSIVARVEAKQVHVIPARLHPRGWLLLFCCAAGSSSQ